MENSSFIDDFWGWTSEMRDYFTALPGIVKRSVIESGVKFNSLEDLKQKTAHLKDNA
ncbi:MAG: hypothetical protein R2876_04385 [Eubacteriales bacterium]